MYEILKKKYGQNFLIDQNIIKKICSLIPNKYLKVIEIGPGDGRLTDKILFFKPKDFKIIQKAARVIPK